MIKLYKPIKQDADIKGYWIDADKLYIDNIVIINYLDGDKFKVDSMELLKTELCIFYVINGIGYIQDRQGNKTILKYRIKILKHKVSKKYIKDICIKYGGVTIFKNTKGYMLYIYTV